jgi:hypothetical protein
MADRLFGIVRHESLQLGLRAFMVEKGLPRISE